ncbi:MAG: T9SS type A sorting domain-containing protein [Bacteroidetes bacterium]|nr:T9SS type A sorting domain-containing protein [Bacteroidota bacterium]
MNPVSKNVSIELIDLSGKKIFSRSCLISDEDHTSCVLNFNGQGTKIEEGIYLATITQANSSIIKKVICQGFN